MTQLETTRIPAEESVSDLLRELAVTQCALRSTPAFVSGVATINPQFVELAERLHRLVRMLRARRLSAPAVGGRRTGSGGSSSDEPVKWPGREEGLTPREAEVIALVTSGLSNNEIADRTHLSINSVESYIRSAYRTMGVTSRSKAVLWGIDHGMAPTLMPVLLPNSQTEGAQTARTFVPLHTQRASRHGLQSCLPAPVAEAMIVAPGATRPGRSGPSIAGARHG